MCCALTQDHWLWFRPVFQVLQVVVVVVEEDSVIALLLFPLRDFRKLMENKLRGVVVGGEGVLLRSVDQGEGGRPLILLVDKLLLRALEVNVEACQRFETH